MADAHLALAAPVLLFTVALTGMELRGDRKRAIRYAVGVELAAREGAVAGIRPARAVPRGACAGARAGETSRPHRPNASAAVVGCSAGTRGRHR